MPDYPHLHLRNLGRASKEFRPKGMGDNEYPAEIPDRPRHARNLQSQLATAAGRLDAIADRQKAAGVAAKRRGITIAATARKGEEIGVGSLKLNSRGLQLLSLKKSQGGRDVATLFVSAANIKGLNRALDKYGAYREGDRPRRFRLFESISGFEIASVADLWNDEPGKLPGGDAKAEWEIWLRMGSEDSFRHSVERRGLVLVGKPTSFVDTVVYNVVATAHDIEEVVQESAAVVELRSASSFTVDYGDLDPEERLDALAAVMGLVTPPGGNSPITTVLDTGANHANPLLGVALAAVDCRTVEPHWPTNDHSGHGTTMAGIALYGDLEKRIDDGLPFTLETRLESIVVSAPSHGAEIPAHDAIERAVALLPDDGRKRILCLAQTAPNDFTDGRQSTLSGVVDRAAWNDGDATRLLCVAAGNARPNVDRRYPIGPYDSRNASHRMESPSQAVNALTVGASTHKCSDDWEGLASAGDLCPSSRTSQQWDVHYAYKPDIVMEGGNQEVDIDDTFSYPSRETMILSAGKGYPTHPFDWTGETSAATARAAGIATRLQAGYPELRAETLRGMMIHSAEWTPAMQSRLAELRQMNLSTRDARANLLQCFGWGIPDEERLYRSAADALTLIVEDELRPYKPGKSGGTAMREMKYFRLPWPSEALKELNQSEVEMRCTLSYFAEPDPHAASRSRLDRYASHRLRFDVRLAGETELQAQQRVNLHASEDDVEEMEDADFLGASPGEQKRWFLGDLRRRRGTVHHDIWTGPAYELADRGGISIYPVKGWWADRRDDTYHDRSVPFSLMVSIRTSSGEVDLMAEARTKVKAGTLVTAPVAIVT